jgi:hypothetical protein
VFPRQSGATWLAPLWAELAGRAAALPFRADDADAHAAPLFLLAARWAEASDATSRIASWQRPANAHPHTFTVCDSVG